MGDVAQTNVHQTVDDTGALSPEQASAAAGVESVSEIPDKFRKDDGSLDTDALLAAALANETSEGEPAKEPDTEKTEGDTSEANDKADETEGEPDNEQDKQVVKALAEKGLDVNDFQKEWDEGGELSEDSYAKLEAAGYPKDMVDTYVSGLQARKAAEETAATEVAQQEASEILDAFGGKESYDQIASWAAANSHEAATRYNDALDSQDVAAAKRAAADLYVAFRQAEGSEPNRRVQGGDTPADGARFHSRAAAVQAQKDPRYRTDPAYRTQVEQKIINSTF